MFDKLEKIFAERALAGNKPRLRGVGYSANDNNLIGIITDAGEAYFHVEDLTDLIDQLLEYEDQL